MELFVYDVTCEYRKNPIGLDLPHPRFSWKLRSANQNVVQEAYLITVSEEPDFSSLTWESGIVESDQSVLVEYSGPALKPCTRYYYKVKAWDNYGQESGYSEPAYFETAFFQKSAWKAKWIVAPEVSDASPLFRKEFLLKEGIRSARLYISALGVYEFSLNGKKGNDTYLSPGFTSYHHRIQYQTYDVTELVSPGRNALGISVGKGWYMGNLAWENQKQIFGDQRAVLAQLQILYENGRREMLITDETWKTAEGPVQMSEIYHGETYDARLEQTGWDCPLFSDKDWNSVQAIDHTLDTLEAQNTVPVKAFERIQAVKKLITPRGETVLDFGQNMVGFVSFQVTGKTGDQVVLEHAEVLDKDGNFYVENMRSAQNRITYILKGGETETYHPHFTFQGFRYVKVSQCPEEVLPENFTGVVLHSEMERTGNFTCSNPLVNQLQHNILWGQKGNFLDIPTDCPQRDERLGWTGDAQAFIRTACFNMNTASFFTKWLKDLRAEQTMQYGVPHVIPNVLKETDCGSSAWSDAAVICPWTIYLCYGDQNILREQYQSMKDWVQYIYQQGENRYLYNTGFHFGDWLGLDGKENSCRGATPEDFIATAFYAYSTSIVAKTAKILKKEKDAAHYKRLYEKIVKNFQKEFVTPNGRLAAHTQTAHVLALMFDLVKGETRKRTIDTLASMIRENGNHLTTGFVGTPYLCHVLSDNGYNQLAYQLLLQTDYPSWLYQVEKGATTIWEHWDGIKEDGSFWSKDMNSFNHYAYGAIGDWLYQKVCGIRVDEEDPGYHHFFIEPQVGEGLEYAEASYRSMYGEIASGWRREKGSVVYTISVPANTTATIVLPSRTLEVGSGNYVLKEI